MRKHTPGPWIVCTQDDDTGSVTVFAEHQLENNRISADKWDYFVAHANVNHIEAEANARLIAAAPELLKALKGLLGDIIEYQTINNISGCENNHWQVIAKAAIEKAEGTV